MKKYIFSGKVHPERYPLTLPSITGKVAGQDKAFEATIFASINQSQVTVVLETTAELSTVDLKNTIVDFVHSMVDTLTYLNGTVYSLEIISVYIPDTGYSEVFDTSVVKINKDQTNRPFSYEDSLQLALATPQLRSAVRDFRIAVNTPIDTSFHCTRVVDDIKNYFSDSWDLMRQALSYTKEELQEITDAGKPTRHGSYRSVTGDERVELMIKTQKVIDRFAQYLKNH